MDSVIVEVRAAEGGADAKDLVREQFSIYEKYCARNCL
jgi:protein subunit release factor A